MRAEAAQEHEHRIVVGVDGSGQSVQALAWASRQAKLTGATVEAVIAWGADLLVVGSRGHGDFAEALLGSVGQHCVQHATCPVVVIRDSAGP
jgi:nucleotide-binding universal stress UspA family protein